MYACERNLPKLAVAILKLVEGYLNSYSKMQDVYEDAMGQIMKAREEAQFRENEKIASGSGMQASGSGSGDDEDEDGIDIEDAGLFLAAPACVLSESQIEHDNSNFFVNTSDYLLAARHGHGFTNNTSNNYSTNSGNANAYAGQLGAFGALSSLSMLSLSASSSPSATPAIGYAALDDEKFLQTFPYEEPSASVCLKKFLSLRDEDGKTARCFAEKNAMSGVMEALTRLETRYLHGEVIGGLEKSASSLALAISSSCEAAVEAHV
jgi:hypothetical protein